MLRRIIIFFICVILSIKKLYKFPVVARIVGFSINLCIVSTVKEAENVKRSVAFECVAVAGSEKMFSSRPVVSYSGSNIMMNWSYGIWIHYEVTEKWMHTVLVSGLRHSDLNGKRTRGLPACSIVLQQTTLPCPCNNNNKVKLSLCLTN
jgi:hypothetical protein